MKRPKLAANLCIWFVKTCFVTIHPCNHSILKKTTQHHPPAPANLLSWAELPTCARALASNLSCPVATSSLYATWMANTMPSITSVHTEARRYLMGRSADTSLSVGYTDGSLMSVMENA